MKKPHPLAVCKHCKKKAGVHKADSFHCPTGSKTRIGYTSYHSTQVFEESEASRKKGYPKSIFNF